MTLSETLRVAPDAETIEAPLPPVVLWVFRGHGRRPQDDVNKLRTLTGITVVNEELPRSVALRVHHPAARTVIRKITGWTLYEDHQEVDLLAPSSGAHHEHV